MFDGVQPYFAVQCTKDTPEEKTAKATARAPSTRMGTYSFTSASLLALVMRSRLWAGLYCNRRGFE